MKRVLGLLALAGAWVLLVPGAGRAEVGMSGLSGYFNAPSAEVLKDGTVEMGYNMFARDWAYDHRGRYSNNAYFATLGFLPRVEVMVRVTALPGFIAYAVEDTASKLTDADRMWAGKAQLIRGSGFLPDVAVGAEDPLGTRRFHAVYLVAGRRLKIAGAEVRVDAGVAPRLLRRVTNYTLHGGFGGIEIRPIRYVALVAEYDSEKWNVGLKAATPLGLTGRLVWLHARTLSGGLGISFRL
jgi:hypothetical protein